MFSVEIYASQILTDKFTLTAPLLTNIGKKNKSRPQHCSIPFLFYDSDTIYLNFLKKTMTWTRQIVLTLSYLGLSISTESFENIGTCAQE